MERRLKKGRTVVDLLYKKESVCCSNCRFFVKRSEYGQILNPSLYFSTGWCINFMSNVNVDWGCKDWEKQN